MRYRDLVEDGHVPGLLVHPDWWEPKHPQEIPVEIDDPIALVEIDDPIALYRPAPEISVEQGYGNPNTPPNPERTVPLAETMKQPFLGTLAQPLSPGDTQIVCDQAVRFYFGDTLFVARPATKNLIHNSNRFEDVHWTKEGVIITDGAARAPDNSFTAGLAQDTNDGIFGTVQIRQDVIGIPTSSTITWSGHFSPKLSQWVFLSVTNMGSLTQAAWFDVLNGVLGTTVGNNFGSAAISAAGDMYRCSIEFVSDATDANVKPTIRFSTADNLNAVTRSGQVSSSIYGLQFEAGTLSSYEETDGQYFNARTTLEADTPSFVVPFNTPYEGAVLPIGTGFYIETRTDGEVIPP
jgi:hypothetical protein